MSFVAKSQVFVALHDENNWGLVKDFLGKVFSLSKYFELLPTSYLNFMAIWNAKLFLDYYKKSDILS